MRPRELQTIKMSFSSPDLIGCFISAPPPPGCTKLHTPFTPVLRVGWMHDPAGSYNLTQSTKKFQLLLATRLPAFPSPALFCLTNTIHLTVCPFLGESEDRFNLHWPCLRRKFSVHTSIFRE